MDHELFAHGCTGRLVLQACGQQTGSSLRLLPRREVFPRLRLDPHGRCAACLSYFHGTHTHIRPPTHAPARLTTATALGRPLRSCLMAAEELSSMSTSALSVAGPAAGTTAMVRMHANARSARTDARDRFVRMPLCWRRMVHRGPMCTTVWSRKRDGTF